MMKMVKMVKMVLFVLSFSIVSVQSKITIKNKIKLIEEGDPVTLVCDIPSAKWKEGYTVIVHCEHCPSTTCNIHEDYDKRITASCNKTHSILHFTSTSINDDMRQVQCTAQETDISPSVYLHVGRYNGDLHSKTNSAFALYQEGFTLVCQKKRKVGKYWRWWDDQGKELMHFLPHCAKRIDYDTRFDYTCNALKDKTTLHIKNVSLSDDGTVFGCGVDGDLSLFRITVNVPVTSVYIQPQSKVYGENEVGIFICNVERSKPEASVKWVIVHRNGSSQEIQQNSTTITKTVKGSIWQTNSILKLTLTRYLQKLMCKATIENLPWTNSEYQSLNIEYPPEITIHHDVTKLEHKGKIICESQANPNDTHYRMVQKWGTSVKKEIPTHYLNFSNFSFKDLGDWVCLASNNVPIKEYYSEKSVEIKLNVSAQFEGETNETAMVGSQKHLKICFYCYPEATEVTWYKGEEEMSSDRISYVPAEDGLFPFSGNCSILEVDVTEEKVHMYYLHVTNLIGKRTFELTLDIQLPTGSMQLNWLIALLVVAVIVIIIIIVAIVKCRRRPPRMEVSLPMQERIKNVYCRL